jgi:histidinol dehydrogenase
MNLAVNNWNELDLAQRRELLRRPAVADDASIQADVRRIIDSVRSSGDKALSEFTRTYDDAELSDFRVSADELTDATSQLTESQLGAIDLAIENVGKFHALQKPSAIAIETMPGVVCERISQAIDIVGMYVPAGTAPLPSAAIMLAVPAVIAGCPRIFLCTPPRPDGTADPAVLVAASRAGVDEIYKVGGAQAIAAMAYGTVSIPKANKIFGPGNAWVTSAKSLVSTDPDGAAIDMPAGPSEVLVIADGSANAEFIAADLLSQAEHGPDSQVLLITNDASLAAEVQQQLDSQLQGLSRATTAAAALENSSVVLVDDIGTAIEVSNQYAPEHLILQIDNPRSMLSDIRNAGSVFMGPWTPESVGDYCSGTNHVLPTYGHARTYSGLGVEQFMRQMTVQELNRQGLQNISDAVISLAGLEGLDAHAAAVTRRLGDRS